MVSVCTCTQDPTMTCRVHPDRDSIAYCRKRIAELEKALETTRITCAASYEREQELAKENLRLREAVELIAESLDAYGVGHCRDIARAALLEEE